MKPWVVICKCKIYTTNTFFSSEKEALDFSHTCLDKCESCKVANILYASVTFNGDEKALTKL